MTTESDFTPIATGETALPVTGDPELPDDDPRRDHESRSPNRRELLERALQSRNSYQLGQLPDEIQGKEIDLALEREAEEETTLGVAYRILILEDIPDDERISRLQQHFGHSSPGTAVGLRQHLDATRFGIFPKGTSMARQIAARLNSTLKNHRHEFTSATQEVLVRNIASLEGIASNAETIEAEQDEAEKAEQSVEHRLKDRAGV